MTETILCMLGMFVAGFFFGFELKGIFEMTKELEKEAEDIVYGMGYDTYEHDGHSDFAVRDILLKFAEPRENRIRELEEKLEQTEKVLADYQFNYPSIKELEKENARMRELLKTLSESVVLNADDVFWNLMDDVEKFLKEKTE